MSKKQKTEDQTPDATVTDIAEVTEETTESGPSRATKRALYKTTLRHPSELTIARDGSYADDGRADLPISEKLVRSMLRFSDQSHDGSSIRAFQSLLPIQVTIEGTDEAPTIIVTDGRQRIKSAMAINDRVASIRTLWGLLGHDGVKTKNTLIKLSRGGEAANEIKAEIQALIDAKDDVGDIIHDLSTLINDLAWIKGDGVAPAGEETMSEEVAALYVGGTVAGTKVKGFMGKKDGEATTYHLKVTYKDTPTDDAETLAISATLKNIQVANPLTVEAQQIKRLMDVKDAAGHRLYSDEYIADAFGCVPLTLYNKLLILHVVPEVAAAVDAGQISWKKLRDGFFENKNVKKPVPLPRSEQIDMLNALVGCDAGKGSKADAVINEVRGKEASGKHQIGDAGAANDNGGEVDGGDDGMSGAKGDGTGGGVGGGKVKRKDFKFDPHWFRRGASVIATAMDRRNLSSKFSDTLHSVDGVDNIDKDTLMNLDLYAESMKEAAAFVAVQATLLFLAGDSSALDEFPNLRQAMGAALTPDAEVPTPKAMSLTERESIMSRLSTAIGEWQKTEGTPDHTTWPVGQRDDEVAAIIEMQAAWDKKTADGDTGEDRILFAIQWVTATYAAPLDKAA